MSTRKDIVDEAARAARRRITDVVDALRGARLAAGLSQNLVATGLHCSRQLVGHVESGRVADPSLVLLSRYAAVVSLEVSLRAFPAGSPMRDAGQLALLARFRATIGAQWQVRTEVPVGGSRRAFDAVISIGRARVAVECVTRLTDAQAQVRAALLKVDAAGIRVVIVVLADTRWNRVAVRHAAPTLDPAFPLRRRALLHSLRVGEVPAGNGVLLV